MQFPDRYKWYEAKFAADDMPDWNPGRFISASQQAPHMRLLTFEVEISRERVPLRNAYKAAGQRMNVRVNGGEKRSLTVCEGGDSWCWVVYCRVAHGVQSASYYAGCCSAAQASGQHVEFARSRSQARTIRVLMST
jgi:hypothetical protein